MVGISIPAAPGFDGWTRLRDGSYKSMRAEDIAEMDAALKADIADCGCDPTAFGPMHGTSFVHFGKTHTAAVTYHCRSWSRWFNPATRQMEGRAHCSCDGCF